jgi:hypothetical protein
MPGLTFRVDRGRERSLLAEALAAAGWVLTSGDDWQVSVRWLGDLGAPPSEDRGRRVCHFRGIGALSNKALLGRTLERARALAVRRGGPRGGFAFYPRTFRMPDGLPELRAEANRWPAKRWIQKPAGLSRGRGVELLPSVDAVVPEPGWVVQEYVERPHLLDGFRYTLRTYLLLTSLDPLLAYVFPDGLVKCAADRGAEGQARRGSYLTNMAVVRRLDEREGTARNLTFPDYRERLAAEGRDFGALWARIRRLSIELAVAGREAILARGRQRGAERPGGFELLALDLAVDDAMTPWVLECNVAPDLEVLGVPGSAFAERERAIKLRVVTGMARLVEASLAADASGERGAGTAEERVRRRAALELASRGDFERVFPARDSTAYLGCFPFPRYADLVLARAERPAVEVPDPSVVPAEGLALEVTADAAALRVGPDALERRLNPTAAYIWQANADGLRPAAIAAELARLFPATDRAYEHDVRAALAEWAEDGLLVDASATRHVDQRVDQLV